MKYFWDKEEITMSVDEKAKKIDDKTDEISKQRPEGIFGEFL